MKAFLVINKPRYCEECSLCSRDSDEGYFCPVNIEADTLNTYGEEDPRYHTIRKGCPLIFEDDDDFMEFLDKRRQKIAQEEYEKTLKRISEMEKMTLR